MPSKKQQRLLFTVAYDGASFAGWQSQPNGNTVQNFIESAFAKILGTPLRIHAAGRTDAGVHALAQQFHADLPAPLTIDCQTWVRALNGNLPPTIRILAAKCVASDFHARFSAKKKIYRYTIRNAAILPPYEIGRVWLVPRPLSLIALREAAQIFVGTHDFTAFSAKRDDRPCDGHRTIYSLRVSQKGTLLRLEFVGNGFLYKMVRMLVAALVRYAHKHTSAEELRAFLTCPEPRWKHSAPAAGLCLVAVR